MLLNKTSVKTSLWWFIPNDSNQSSMLMRARKAVSFNLAEPHKSEWRLPKIV